MRINRNITKSLLEWKNKPHRKPLIIQGARQVGKTWLMRELGASFYQNTVYLNFDDMRELHELFAPNLDTARIIASLGHITNTKIEPENTLIIFDEIQECNRALASLKYFCENAPEYHIIAAGSFLGVALHEGNTFPVGKVEIKTLYPLTFFEFLEAAGEGGLVQAAALHDFAQIEGLKSRYIALLKHYFFTGGMPEAVAAFAGNRNLEQIREIQRTIVKSYSADFSKHINLSDIPKVNLIWNSLPAQIAKEKKKFVYNDIKPGARAREYENALTWLVNSGLAYQINRVSLPGLPLISYQEREHFKLYMLDVGLLASKTELDIGTLLTPDTSLFNHFKGALIEQYVLQELKALDGDLPVFYWTNAKNNYEIDFVIQKWDSVVPLEVKAETNLKSKSLKTYIAINKPQKAIRASLVNYNRHGVMHEVPLYLMGELFNIINDH
jgi:predicted AAA+ superfamily ATPase